MASTHMGSIIWSGWRYIPHGGEDSDGRVGDVVNSSNVSNQPPPIVGSKEDSFPEVVDCDEEEMHPFDAETFVDRLVEDDPPPQFANGRAKGDWIWEAPVAAEIPRGVGEIGNKHPPGEAKPYAQPIFFWADPEREARADSVKAQVCEDEAVVGRNGPILGALYTPARISSPEVAPGEALELIPETNHRGDRGFHYGDRVEFEPVTMDNNSPAVGLLCPDSEVPWVPARPGCGDFCMTSPCPTTYAGGSDDALEPVTGAAYAHATSSSITAAPPRLVVADGGEYDDEQHAFLRKQEVTRYVGPGYLLRPGKPGLVTPEQRASLVNLIVRVHEAAPAASGNATPLSVEALALAVSILDRFLSTSEGGKVALSGWGEVEVASVACLGLASKYEDTQPSTLLGLAVVMASENDQGDGLRGDNLLGQGGVDDDVRAMRKKIVAMEQRVSSALGYRLTVPTVLSFLGVFIHRACLLGYLPGGQAKKVVRKEAERTLLRVLRESCSLSHLPSALAAAALYWASCTTPGIVAPSSFTFFSVTGYHLESLYCCLRDVEIVRIASGAGGMGWGNE